MGTVRGAAVYTAKGHAFHTSPGFTCLTRLAYLAYLKGALCWGDCFANCVNFFAE